MDFTDRVAVVTGSARGIGKAIARKLFELHAGVVIADLNQEDVDAACKDIAERAAPEAAERICGFACDVSQPDSVDALFRSVKSRFNQLDILVNNAGITRDNLFMRMSFEQWKLVIDVNLNGTFLCCRHALPLLRKSKHGRIVNLSSISAGGNIGQANYAASKAGVVGLTKTLSLELARRQITVNAVAPGFIDTEMTRAIPEKDRQHWIDHIPSGRPGSVDDVADSVIFLVSDDASFITGEVLAVDGGLNTPETVVARIGEADESPSG